ncbi:hypothetical protein Ahy_A07g036794 [Arachis hypogaea]|uniref:BED-type domain-containing protein n=1 Tax=Arachis hypogaea TaxID=3818 RepID=A0A445CH04_ARAHY|nr:hypothetical protein Ahy_A07g036794 [Arachis hypogaea]
MDDSISMEVDGGNITQNPKNLESSEMEEDIKKKKTKAVTSDVWRYFTKLGPGDDGIDRAQCDGCKQKFKAGGKQYGTSSLKRHLDRCVKIDFEDIGQTLIEMQNKMGALKIDNHVSREMFAAFVIDCDVPFSIVDNKKFRNWVKYISPTLGLITRNTLKEDVLKIYSREKEKLKSTLLAIPNRVCLTSDLWTSITTEGYLCLTAHFVDLNWKLQSKILSFCHMPPPHTGFELSSKIFELLNEWGIEKKIMTLTLDNASANDTCQDHLKSTLNMHDWLLCDGEFFHIRCSAHILNLIVQDGLKIAHDALDKIRESVKYVRGSESRMIRFKECVSAIQGLNFTSGLHLDVTTRWNSTYIMLESAIKYRKAFEYLKATDHAYKYCPSVDEWGRAEKICEFLYPFYETTNLISGTSYPTSNLYFLQVYHIQCVLMGSLRSEDELLRSMGEKMMNKFKKYWEKYSVILAFGAILDPRLKISTLELMYEEIDAETAKGKVEHVKKKLYKLFEKYDKNSLPIVQAQGPSIQSSSMAHTPESATKKRLAIVGVSNV